MFAHCSYQIAVAAIEMTFFIVSAALERWRLELAVYPIRSRGKLRSAAIHRFVRKMFAGGAPVIDGGIPQLHRLNYRLRELRLAQKLHETQFSHNLAAYHLASA